MPKASVDALFEEIKARLHEELDYQQEAENLIFYWVGEVMIRSMDVMAQTSIAFVKEMGMTASMILR